MDPNSNLDEQKRLAARIVAAFDKPEPSDHFDEDDVLRLAELVQALDGWLAGGGFLPSDWARKRTSK